MSKNSLDSLDYNPLVDVKELLANQESTQDLSIKELVSTTKLYKNYLAQKLEGLQKSFNSDSISDVSNEGELSNDDLKESFKDLALSIETFHTEHATFMTNVRNIQTSKKNLIQTVKYFKCLETLRGQYVLINNDLQKEDYIDILAMFNDYSSNLQIMIERYERVVDTEEMNRFKAVYDNLEMKCKTYIKQLFQEQHISVNKSTSGESDSSFASNENLAISKQQFHALFKIIGLFKDKTIIKNIENWIIDNNVLFEFKQIFNVNDEVEVTSLENLDRRFIFFKKVLTTFILNYENDNNNWFLSDFNLSLKLTQRFCELTGEDLEIILKREFESNDKIAENSNLPTGNGDLFMTSLEKCLEFEKYVKLKFKNKLITDAISSKFKPYISIWITKQEDLINQKIKKYLSDPKLSSDGSKDMIISSSMDLFRTYKNILNESLQLITSSKSGSKEGESGTSNDKVFKKLAKLYNSGITNYQTQILDPLVVRNYKETIANTKLQDIIDYTVLVVNTCDYLVTTIEDLSLKLQEYCEKGEYKNRIDDILSSSKQSLIKLINYNISTVLMGEIISKELEYVFKEFQHVNWSNIADTAVTNRYASSLAKIMSNEKACSLLKITSLFYKEIYIYNLFDKLVNHIITTFSELMIKVLSNKANTSNDKIIKLWAVDIPEIIDFLQKFPTTHITNISATTNGMKRCSETTLKELNNKLGNFVNLLNSPLDQYTDSFMALTFNCDNSIVWLYILKLKGIQDPSKLIELWNEQAVGRKFVADSNNWFIFTGSKFLQDAFIDYNNTLYIQGTDQTTGRDSWKKFLNEMVKVVEFKKIVTQPKRSISPQIESSKQQQGIQQRIGMLWNSI